MSVVLTIPSQVYSANTREFGPAIVPVGVTAVRVTFTREGWPLTVNDPILTVRISVSLDGGATWPRWAECQWFGGTRTVIGGGTATEESIQRSIPEWDNSNRRIKISLINTSSLRTAITLETF